MCDETIILPHHSKIIWNKRATSTIFYDNNNNTEKTEMKWDKPKPVRTWTVFVGVLFIHSSCFIQWLFIVCVCGTLSSEMRSSIESKRLTIFTMHIRQKRITTAEEKKPDFIPVTIGIARLKIHAQSVCGNWNGCFELFLVTLSCSCRRGFLFYSATLRNWLKNICL